MADDPLTDDVLDGVRAARERFAARHGYDVYVIGAALRRMAAGGDWPVAGRAPVASDPTLVGQPAIHAGDRPNAEPAASADGPKEPGPLVS